MATKKKPGKALAAQAVVPAPVDFATEAAPEKVAQMILKDAGMNPLVTLSLGAGVVGGVAILALGTPFYVLLPLLIGGGAFAWKYWLRRGASTSAYLDRLRTAQRAYLEGLPVRVRADLEECGSKRGIGQLEQLEDAFTDFEALLKRKFSADGLTLSHFLGTAEQVRAGALMKLQMVTDQMKAIESIPEGLERELKEAKGKSAELIRERLGYRTRALDTVEQLHVEVEESLTSLSKLSLQIARVGMEEERGLRESQLIALRALAQQASEFRREH